MEEVHFIKTDLFDKYIFVFSHRCGTLSCFVREQDEKTGEIFLGLPCFFAESSTRGDDKLWIKDGFSHLLLLKSLDPLAVIEIQKGKTLIYKK